ncbi:MAG TPA: ATP-dependent DNA helicase RecG [Candidatus Dormibacteraeota bacterium]|nr:ATP-dependent DNA helicase RecG [Candidatus Dormibacteraeota bacterium]
MTVASLETPLGELPRISPERLHGLHRLGLNTVMDLLRHFPRRYDDQRERVTLSELVTGTPATVEVTVAELHPRRARYRRMELLEAEVHDDSATAEVIWFNQPYLRHILHQGDRITLHGKAVRTRRGGIKLQNPEMEREQRGVAQSKVGVLVPTYPETARVTSRWLRARIAELLPLAGGAAETLPRFVRQPQGLMPLGAALQQMHFPEDHDQLDQAKLRFGFEELFFPQLAALLARRQRLSKVGTRSPYDVALAREFVAALPFRLTEAQRRAAHEILIDLDRPAPMNRLLQGDVGSGKTVVAAMAARMAIAAGHQVVLMAPTEILARQHQETMRELLSPFGIWPRLLVGSTRVAQRREILGGLAAGADKLVVGTHSLIEDEVRLPQLGLCIVDEQHRFGVAQRLRLRDKSESNPDFLSMTATPIPRSLSLTLYGDLDVSQIRELPPNRHPVKTLVVEPSGREDAYDFIRSEIKRGRQGFIICPLIEDSPGLEVRSATAEYERLSQEVLPELRLVLLHGRLAAREKAERMAAFARHEFDLLVATSVIEVGVDVPNATVIGIEGADRFGLAQLHQFRGRVGRGEYESHCLLFADEEDPAARRRLQALIDHQDGFELAEVDLRLRGSGDPYGLVQHGFPEMRVGDLLDDGLRERARSAAELVLASDPNLRDRTLRTGIRGYQVVFEFD